MQASPLRSQIDAFQRLLPTLQQDIGSRWVVVAGGESVGDFDDFASASRFVDNAYPAQDVLIRHTNAQPASIPFVAIED